MKTKIKGNWVDFHYAVNISNKELVKKLFEDSGYDAVYLGKSKVYMDKEGNIHHLKSRSTFWIITQFTPFHLNTPESQPQ